MPAFKDEHIIIIAPGSETTLAQLGLPESFTPARLRVKSRMFAAPDTGRYEPSKITKKPKAAIPSQTAPAPGADPSQANGDTSGPADATAADAEEYEEDLLSDEGAIWPMQAGKVVDWPCFFALMEHVHELLNGPFHTPILLIAQPCWTAKDHERLVQFFFEKFKCPAFALVDAATAACYAFAQPTATVIDIGKDKADVTSVVEFLVDGIHRTAGLKSCGGNVMTSRLQKMLGTKGFTREMCEQLKRSPICEILPPGTPLPGSDKLGAKSQKVNPASAASTGVNGSGPAQGQAASAVSDVPQGPGPNTAVGDGQREEEDNEGVLDVASIVTGGKMNEYLAKKEKEKAEKAAARKKGGDAGASAKPVRLRNAERESNSFYFEDQKLSNTLKASNMSADQIAEATATLDEGPKRSQPVADSAPASADPGAAPVSPVATTKSNNPFAPIRREISVGVERFQPHTGEFMVDLTSAIHKTILAYPEPQRRSQLWENIVIIGNGSRIRGFKEALMANLQSRFLISPSSATIFTSELPSTFSTPNATGANTPQPGMSMQQRGNPLLYAATTASGQHLLPQQPHGTPGGAPLPSYQFSYAGGHSSQSPNSIKTIKLPEYFPEWKDAGPEEAAFLGAQVAAKVIFNDNYGGTQKGFMSRSDYNESGPEGIHSFSF